MWWFRGEAKVEGALGLRSRGFRDAGAIMNASLGSSAGSAALAPAIHPSACVEAGAQLGAGVEIGPFCHVGSKVVLGDGVRLISHVSLAGDTSIGARTRIFPFASIGHEPQDLKYRGEPVTPDHRRGLPHSRRRDDESRHRGRRLATRSSARAAPSWPTPMSPMIASSATT